MKMSDVKVGMKLRSTVSVSPGLDIVTVEKITPSGFEYSIPTEIPFRSGETFATHGHEHYGLNGEALFEPYEPDFQI